MKPAAGVLAWLSSASVSPRARRHGYVVASIATLAELTVPVVVAWGVAQSLSGDDTPWAAWAAVVLAVVLAALAVGIRTWRLDAMAATELRELRATVAAHLVRLPPRAVEQLGAHEAVDLFSRYTDHLNPLLTAGRIRRRLSRITIVAALGLMAVIEWRLLLLLLLVLAGAAGIVALALAGVRARAGRIMEVLGQAAAELGDFLRSVRSAKVYGLDDTCRDRLGACIDEAAALENRLGRSQAVVDTTVKLVTTLALLLIGAVGAVLVSQDSLSLARLSGFLAAFALVVGPVAEYAALGQQYRRAGGALARLELLAALPNHEVTGGARARPWTGSERLQADAARGWRVVARAAEPSPHPGVSLPPVTFGAQPGQLVCLTGPSGSGKSTFLGALAGYVPLIGGELVVGGVDVGSWDQRALRQHIGFVDQDAAFLGLSIRSFLSASGAHDDRTVHRMLARLGLDERVAQHGLDTPVHRAGANLSGGERQRLSLARALLSDRPLLLLDEPTANLDRRTERDVIFLLREDAWEGRLIIAATHSPTLVQEADLVVELDPASSRRGSALIAPVPAGSL